MTTQTVPKVKVQAVRQNYGTWLLVIHDCPFCHQEHTHNGGDERTPILGNRRSHCAGDRSEWREYELSLK